MFCLNVAGSYFRIENEWKYFEILLREKKENKFFADYNPTSGV
jgi:hypothetical protein